MNTYNPQQTIGFITGGQLGKMMGEAFQPLRQNETILVMDTDIHCPCKHIADEVVVGSSKQYDDVLNFGMRCDTIILEFEHVNIEALKKLEAMGKRIIAQPKYIEIIQNKGTQKQFLKEHNIPTAPFFLAENKKDCLLKITESKFGYPCIQKTCTDGYDGGGVKKIHSEDELANMFDAPSVIEQCIPIEKEFSLILGRDDAGTEFQYPVIEQSFDAKTHIVDTVWFAENIPDSVDKQITNIGEKLMKAFQGTGMFAIELFLDTSGGVVVNEIAPRVHNSGHHTLECSATSQFEQYIRIALGLPAGSTKTIQKGVMANLLGEEGYTGKSKYDGIEKAMQREEVHIHLYGKTHTKPHRKMGHVTVVNGTHKELAETVTQIKAMLKVTA